ncbi:MAG: cache domain-containing protein [Chamaesiphon sp.]|nr:cache domain-containing protein [Chamaesiphon sp.]
MKSFIGSFYSNWSIGYKIAVAMILAVVVPMTISAYLNLQQVAEIATNGEYRQLELLASNAAQQFDRLLLARQDLVTAIGNRVDVQRYLATPQSDALVLPQLTELVAVHQDIEAILLLDPQGNCVTATKHQFVGQTYILPETKVFPHLHGNVRDYLGLFVTHQLAANHRSGAVLLKLKEAAIWSGVSRVLPPKTAGQFFLIDERGTRIGQPQLSLVDRPIANVTPDLPPIAATNTSGHISYQPSLERSPQIIGFTTLATQPWVLGLIRSQSEFQAPLSDITRLNLQGAIVVGIVAAFIAMLLGTCISRPIQGLTIAAQSLERSEDEISIEQIHQDLAKFAATPDDLGQLVRAFLKMVDERHRRDLQLKHQVQSLRIQIDRQQREQDVAEITESDGFMQLQQKIRQLRNHKQSGAETETDYFQRLQNRVQSIKERV